MTRADHNAARVRVSWHPATGDPLPPVGFPLTRGGRVVGAVVAAPAGRVVAEVDPGALPAPAPVAQCSLGGGRD